MTLTPSQPSFAAGEIAPELFGRVDLAKYQSALQRAENLFVRPHGGIVNRPGTRFVCEAIDSAVPGRLIPFSFSTEQTYILELGDGCMRVILDGGLALESGQPVAAISRAAPAVLQVTAHGLSEGDEVMITGGAGMRELTGAVLVVRNPTSDSFQVSRKDSVVGIDTTAYSAYAGGAQVARGVRSSAVARFSPQLRTLHGFAQLRASFPRSRGKRLDDDDAAAPVSARARTTCRTAAGRGPGRCPCRAARAPVSRARTS